MKLKKGLAFLLLILFLFASTALYAETNELIILHTNDMHGRVSADDDLMGMPYLSSAVKDYRERFENVFVLDAGDALHGRPITDKLEGRSAVELMNRVGYTAMAPGNHDFNYGYQKLIELTELMEFDLLATNVEKEGELLFKPYVVHQMGELKIGIFGLATSDTYSSTHPKNVVGIDFTDMISASEKYVEVLKNREEVDFVIGLTHVGIQSSTKIAESVAGIDLIVDGHSHSFLSSGKRVGETLIVQANEYTKYLGKVRVNFDAAAPKLEASLIPAEEIKNSYEPDQEIVEMLKEYNQEVTNMILGL
ncbi:MAG: metallophosphoesterase [Spirochaetia bacterium]|nr:metallophosphoesterase [Spirochaetia bacterium]